MPAAPQDGDVSEFLREVKQLDESVDRQDSLRTRKLERDIMDDRQRRRDTRNLDREDSFRERRSPPRSRNRDVYDNDDRYDSDVERDSARRPPRRESERRYNDDYGHSDDDDRDSVSSRKPSGRDREKYDRWVEERRGHRASSRPEEPTKSGGLSKKFLGGGPLLKTKKPLLSGIFKEPEHSRSEGHHHRFEPRRNHHRDQDRDYERDYGRDDRGPRRQDRDRAGNQDHDSSRDRYHDRNRDRYQDRRSDYSRDRDREIEDSDSERRSFKMRERTDTESSRWSHGARLPRPGDIVQPHHRSGAKNELYQIPAAERTKDRKMSPDDDDEEERFARMAQRERELEREREELQRSRTRRTDSFNTSRVSTSDTTRSSRGETNDAEDDAPALPSRPSGRSTDRGEKLENLRRLRAERSSRDQGQAEESRYAQDERYDEPRSQRSAPATRANDDDFRNARRPSDEEAENFDRRTPFRVTPPESSGSHYSRPRADSPRADSASYYGASARPTPSFIKSAVDRGRDEKYEDEPDLGSIKIPNPVPRSSTQQPPERSFVNSALDKTEPARRTLPDKPASIRANVRERRSPERGREPETDRKASYGLNTARANLKNVELRDVSPESMKPDDERLNAPRLRSVSPEKRRSGADVSEAEERLANLKLKKPPPRKASASKPVEAFSRLQELRSVSPVPVRKESMPEAIKKRDNLKPANVVKHEFVDEHEDAVLSGKKQLKPVERNQRETHDEIKEMVQDKKASLRSTRSRSPPTPPAPRSQFVDDLSSALQRGPSRESLGPNSLTRTSTIDSDSSADQQLDHLTKSRPRGPKRRLPAGHTSSRESSVDELPRRSASPPRVSSRPAPVGRGKFDTSFLNEGNQSRTMTDRKAPIKLPGASSSGDDADSIDDLNRLRLAASAKKKPPPKRST